MLTGAKATISCSSAGRLGKPAERAPQVVPDPGPRVGERRDVDDDAHGSLHWQPVSVYVDLFRYRDLFLNLFRRELRVKYRGSVLGLALDADQPDHADARLLARLLRDAPGGLVDHYPLFLLSGLVTWVFFQGTIQMLVHEPARPGEPREAGALAPAIAPVRGRRDERS